MTALYIKDPADVLDYEIDWTSRLETAETISSFTVTVSPSGGLAIDSSSEAAGVVTIWVSGGEVGTYYYLDCVVVTSGLRTYSKKIAIKIFDK